MSGNDNGSPPPEEAAHLARRQFFRTFGKQTVSSAGSLFSAAAQLRRSGTAAASELVGLGLGNPTANAARLTQAAVVEPDAGFRSPYIFSANSIMILDQRGRPDQKETIACGEASEVAAAIAAGAAGGGTVLGQLAAYALVLSVTTRADRTPAARQAAFSAAANTLRAARPQTRIVAWAVERMAARWDQLADVESGHEQAAALRAEADSIATEAALDNARLGRLGAELLPVPEGRSLSVLMHADMGALSAGLVGTGVAVVQSVMSEGRSVHVWLTEARPANDGGWLAKQLAQADIAHTLIPDSAVGWLLTERAVDAVLLRADRVCANGDTAALLGSLSVARLAGRAGTPVYACAPTAVIDLASVDGGAVPRPQRVPELDIVPADAITGFLSEQGLVAPPYGESLARALVERDARRGEEA